MFKKVLKLKLKIIGAIVVGLGLVQLISAYFFGVIAEKQFNLQFSHLTKTSLVKVVRHDYDRGWLSSNETVVLSINNQVIKNMLTILPGAAKESAESLADQTYQLSYTTHITHGLFAGWLHGNIMPTFAYAQTKIQFPEKLNNVLNKFFNGKTPLEIDNVLYLNKAGKYLIYSLSFNYDEALSGVKITWGGLNLHIAYNSDFNKFVNQLKVPSFVMIAPTKGSVTLSNLDYTSNSAYSVNNIKVGSTDLKLALLSFELKDTENLQLKFGEIVRLLTGVNSAGFLNGIDAINPANFTISHVSYHSVSKDENNYFGAKAVVGFESLTTNSKNYGPMKFDLSLDHIAAPEFSKLLDNLNEVAGEDQSTQTNRDQTVAVLKTYFTPIFVQEPVISLNSFTLTTPEGVITLSGKVTTKNFESQDMNDQDKFMKKIVLSLDFSVPKPILAYFFVLQMKYFLTAGNAQMDKQSAEALSKVVNILLDNQLQVWLKKGYLTQKDNLIQSKIHMESGIITLNRKTTK